MHLSIQKKSCLLLICAVFFVVVFSFFVKVCFEISKESYDLALIFSFSHWAGELQVAVAL